LIESLSARPRGFFTDIDGTISRIAPTPESAALLPGTAEILDQLTVTFAVVAAVSGRAAEDAARLVGNPRILYIGNHGLEFYQPGTGSLTVSPDALRLRTTLTSVLDEIEASLVNRWPGLRIESKGVTASIHVRGTSDPHAALEEVYRKASASVAGTELKVTLGRMVIELRPALPINKGSAVGDVITERGLRSAIYLGDDRTDLDAFRELRRLMRQGICQGVSVAVRSDESAAEVVDEADIVLDGIDQVPDFLRQLLEH
jgi:trehalose 6-phosphate phosphatase